MDEDAASGVPVLAGLCRILDLSEGASFLLLSSFVFLPSSLLFFILESIDFRSVAFTLPGFGLLSELSCELSSAFAPLLPGVNEDQNNCICGRLSLIFLPDFFAFNASAWKFKEHHFKLFSFSSSLFFS